MARRYEVVVYAKMVHNSSKRRNRVQLFAHLQILITAVVERKQARVCRLSLSSKFKLIDTVTSINVQCANSNYYRKNRFDGFDFFFEKVVTAERKSQFIFCYINNSTLPSRIKSRITLYLTNK